MSEIKPRLPNFAVAALFAGGLFVVPWLPTIVDAQTLQSVGLAELQTLKEISSLQLSPSGAMLAYTVDDDIWLVATVAGSAPRRLATGMVPTWSPEGNKLAYYSTESGTFQLWVADIRTGECSRITNLDEGIDPDPWTAMVGTTGSVLDALRYSWSPDSNKIVFASQIASEPSISENSQSTISEPKDGATPLILTGDTPPYWTLSAIFLNADGGASPLWATWETKNHSTQRSSQFRAPPTSNQLLTVDIHTGVTEQITHDKGGYFFPDWSPDGKTIICASSEGRRLVGWGSGPTNIYSIDPILKRKTAITADDVYKRVPTWSPDGKRIAYLGAEKFQHSSVYIIPGSGGAAVDIASRLDRSIDEFEWKENSDSIEVEYPDGTSSFLALIDTTTGRFSKISGTEAAGRWPSTVSMSGTVAWVQSDGSTTGVIRILPPGGVDAYPLIDLNPQIKEWRLGQQQIVRWKNHRGDELEGILIKPVGYVEGYKYPLIVDGYPGIKNSFKGDPMLASQAFASRGYAVFFPNARAPHTWMNPFKSETFDHAVRGPKGWDLTLDDFMSGVDELIRMGVADPDRMGLFGFSNGGGVVDFIVTATGRFKCAVSVAPVYPDWSLPFFLRTDSTVADFAGGITPWQDPQGYLQLSVVYRLDKITTPILLAAGDNDVHFLLGAIELYNGLRRLKKNVTLLRYASQGHGFDGPALQNFWLKESAFFDKYLKSDATAR